MAQGKPKVSFDCRKYMPALGVLISDTWSRYSKSGFMLFLVGDGRESKLKQLWRPLPFPPPICLLFEMELAASGMEEEEEEEEEGVREGGREEVEGRWRGGGGEVEGRIKGRRLLQLGIACFCLSLIADSNQCCRSVRCT